MSLEEHLVEFRRREKPKRPKPHHIKNRTAPEILKPIENLIIAYNRDKKIQSNLAKKLNRKYSANVLKKYNITQKELDALVDKHCGRCAICLQPSKNLVIDHNHSTGNIRSLLCGYCNSILGFSKENVDILEKAIRYLKIHNSQIADKL